MAPKRKFTPEIEADIRYQASCGVSQHNLAGQYSTTQSLISKIINETPKSSELKPPSADDYIIWLDRTAITPNKMNPRKTFDEAELVTLAESIATDGLLQNLVISPPDDSGLYVLVAGERRWRAINMLAEQNRWFGRIPCRLIGDDMLKNMAVALLENIQRVDLPPLEEANTFLKLIEVAPAIWTTATIAERIGRTQRYVQQRIALATKLAPIARDALIAGKLTIEAARVLTAHDLETQTDVLDDFNVGEIIDTISADDIQSWLPDLADRKIAPNPEPSQPIMADDEDEIDGQLPSAEQAIDEMPSIPPRADAHAADQSPSGPLWTKAHIYHAHKRKAGVMQAAVIDNEQIAIRLVCMALLGPQEAIHIGKTAGWQFCRDDDQPELLVIEATIGRIMAKTKPPSYAGDAKSQLATWKRLNEVKGEDLSTLFCALVARQIRNPAGHNCSLGDDRLALAIAHTLKIPFNEDSMGLTMQREDLVGLRKSLLLRIADEANTPGVNDATPIGELIEAIATKSRDREYVVPTLRFGTTGEIEQGAKP